MLTHLDDLGFEERTRRVKTLIFKLAGEHDVPSDVLAAAIADTLGFIAAKQDLDLDGGPSRGTIDQKLHEVLARADAAYARALVLLTRGRAQTSARR
jgi:hypothetical protein